MWMGVWSINFAFAACAHVATVSCGIDALETQSGIANTLQGSTALRKELWKRGSYTLNSLTAVAAWIIIICRPASWHIVSWHPCVEHIPMHLPKSQHGQILWPAVEHVYWFPSVKR